MAASDIKSTYGTYLQIYDYSSGSDKFIKMIDIKDFPDLGGSPNTIDATSLSDNMQVNVLGIQQVDTLSFTANLTWTEFTRLKTLSDGHRDAIFNFRIVFANSAYAAATMETNTDITGGHQAYWKGQFTIYQNGGGVDEVLGCTITTSNTTEIVYSLPATAGYLDQTSGGYVHTAFSA